MEDHGCRKDNSDDNPMLDTGEWWLTPHNFVFIVPCDGSGILRSDELRHVFVHLARLKPINLE